MTDTTTVIIVTVGVYGVVCLYSRIKVQNKKATEQKDRKVNDLTNTQHTEATNRNTANIKRTNDRRNHEPTASFYQQNLLQHEVSTSIQTQ